VRARAVFRHVERGCIGVLTEIVRERAKARQYDGRESYCRADGVGDRKCQVPEDQLVLPAPSTRSGPTRVAATMPAERIASTRTSKSGGESGEGLPCLG